MKICLISFDYFDYDHFIVLELKKRNIEANHIDISKFHYKYSSFFERITNFFSKLFLNKNIKKLKTEPCIVENIKKLGHQDIILVIRPDTLSRSTHLQIKQCTERYITYIYDSCERFPINHLLDGIFDKIYSFDLYDCNKHKFTFITNYNYLEKRELNVDNKVKNTIFIIVSIDERFAFLNKLANYFTANSIDFKFIVVAKKIPKDSNPNIIFINKHLSVNDIAKELKNASIFLDLIRHNHNGLSFRVFEAMAMQRKIITTNNYIDQYDFYNPNNILIIDENNININCDFLNTQYMPLEDAMYQKYTINNWVEIVFDL